MPGSHEGQPSGRRRTRGGPPRHRPAARTRQPGPGARQDHARLPGRGEQAHAAFLPLRGTVLSAGRRPVPADEQGVTGEKAGKPSVPYRGITRFAVETAGPFGLGAGPRTRISGSRTPITRTFSKDIDVHEVRAVLTRSVTR